MRKPSARAAKSKPSPTTSKQRITRRVTKSKKKKLSGAQFKKIRREKALAAMAANGISQDLISKPTIGKLESVKDWHRQIADIFTLARLGQMPQHVASKLVYVADVGATMCKSIEELKELQGLREQLAAIQNGGAVPHQQFLPAEREA